MSRARVALLGAFVGCCVAQACGGTGGVDISNLGIADSGAAGSGTTGSGGSVGTAGADNTGGDMSSGGGSGGGANGSGGALTGTGGSGTGGEGGKTSGAGGNARPDGGKAGSTGTGGATIVDAGDPCRNLMVAYEQALFEARHCNPAVNALQCQAVAPSSLACPGCSTHVQDASQLTALRAKWTDAGCKGVICPAIACILPGMGTCIPTDGGSGICGNTGIVQ